MTVGEQVAKWGPVARGDIREHARRGWIQILD
jgi:hypothetical protein